MEDLVEKVAEYIPGNFTPLHEAVRCGNMQLVESLINEGADVDARDDDGRTPLSYAVRENSIQTWDGFCNDPESSKKSPKRVNTSVPTGNNIKLVEYLLDHGANVNASNHLRQNALHIALYADDWMEISICPEWFEEPLEYTGKITRLLLERGAEVNGITSTGTTALHAAALMGCDEAVRALLDFNADVFTRNAEGETALELAFRNIGVTGIEMLLKFGDGIQSKDKNGTDLFYVAAKCGYGDVLKSFMKYGTSVNAKDESTKTALHYAAETGSADAIASLFTYGADINCRDNLYETHLHKAASNKHDSIVEILLSYGVDVNALCSRNETALDKAIKCSRYGFALDRHKYVQVFTVLKEHIIMRNFASLFVRPQDLISVGDYDTPDGFRGSCKTEIENMIAKKIGNVSYYDILTSNVNILAKYARDEAISDVFETSEEVESNFPIYTDMLHSQFHMGNIRAQLMVYYDDVILPFLFHCFPELPLLCTDIVLTYLNNDDLKNLMEAWDPAMADTLRVIHLEQFGL